MKRVAIKLAIILALVGLSLGLNKDNNVCKKYSDYSTRWVNKDCWYNPDVDSKTPHMILRHGYPLEIYDVVTEDGYILQMFRIPHNNKDTTKRRQPVYIQHGADTDSAVWVDIGNRSLAFNLVEQGFDVWLGNIRGSEYSQSHVLMNKNQPKFWDFSFHEMGIHDVPAQLDQVAKVTGLAGKIIYIGHSMGTTMSYIYSSKRKEHAEKTIIGIISLAPVAYLHHLKYLQYVVLPNYNVLLMTMNQLRALGVTALTPDEETNQKIFNRACFSNPMEVRACLFLTMVGYGFDTTQLQAEDFPLLLSYLASGWSTKTAEHFVQNTKGPFREFDYGAKINVEKYGTPEAPPYNLSSITVPVHLFFGKNDGLAGEEDVRHLYADLRTSKKSITPILPDDSVKFNHIDFMYAKNIVQFLYEPMFARIMSDLKVEV